MVVQRRKSGGRKIGPCSEYFSYAPPCTAMHSIIVHQPVYGSSRIAVGVIANKRFLLKAS